MKRSSLRAEVRFAGADGQGMPLIAQILAEASFAGRFHVVETSTHEMEVRGGLNISDVIISDSEIEFPKPQGLDILIALSQEGYDAAAEELKKESIQILDSLHVGKISKISQLIIEPLTNISHEKTGSEEYANFVALGLAVKKLKIIKERHILNVIKEKLQVEDREKALKAFKEGLKL